MASNRRLIRWIAVGMGLPAVLVVSDELLLAAATAGRDDLWAAFFVWLVVQTALMSLAAGKWLETWSLRVLVLSWTLLLVNVVLLHAAALAWNTWRRGVFAPDVLAVAFVAAQGSLLAAWLVLGAASWQWRLPAVSITLLPAGLAMSELDRRGLSAEDVWKQIAALQVLSTLVLACILRWRGYRVAGREEKSRRAAAPANAVASQFSLRHLLIWTTALAPLLALLKTLKYAFPDWLAWWQWGLVFAEGALLAPVNVVAFWTALGPRRTWQRIVALAAMAALMAASLRSVERLFGVPPPWLAGGGPGVFISPLSMTITHAGLTWLVWTELSGFLLAGMLLVFRVSGYRLAKWQRPNVAGGRVEPSTSVNAPLSVE